MTDEGQYPLSDIPKVPTIKRIWIGIDNAATGTIGWVSNFSKCGIEPLPTKATLNFQKKGKFIVRIDMEKLTRLLAQIYTGAPLSGILVGMEYPYLGPNANTVHTNARAFEAVLNCVETLGLPHVFLQAQMWQKPVLGAKLKGSAVLKKASRDLARQIFPLVILGDCPDADGILIAYHLSRRAPFGIMGT